MSPFWRQSRSGVAAVLLALVACSASRANAQRFWGPGGVPVAAPPEARAEFPLLCSDGSSGAYVAWHSSYEAPRTIRLQHILWNGTRHPAWPTSGVLVVANSYCDIQTMVPDGSGGLFVIWSASSDYNLFVQHYLADGSIAPDWPGAGVPIVTAPGEQEIAHAGLGPEGSLYVAWTDRRAGYGESDLYAIRIGANGTRADGWPENGLPIAVGPYFSGGGDIETSPDGSLYLFWVDGRNTSVRSEIYAQRLAPDGTPWPGWPAGGKLVIPGDNLARPIRDVVPDGAGGFYIGMDVGPRETIYNDDAAVQRVTADGEVAPGWPAYGAVVCACGGPQWTIRLVPDGSGGVYQVWSGGPGGGSFMMLTRWLGNGTRAPGWPEEGTRASTIDGFQSTYDAVADDAGGLYLALRVEINDQLGYLQRFGPNGQPAPGWPAEALPVVTAVSIQQDWLALTSDGLGGAIVAWEDARYGATSYPDHPYIYAQRFVTDNPTAVEATVVAREVAHDRVKLTWYAASEAGQSATVYRMRAGEAWARLASAAFDGSGRLVFEDRDVSPATRYAYRLSLARPTGEEFSDETWIETPAAPVLALEGFRPNPSIGVARVAFSLPDASPARLELLDVSGRRIAAREVGTLGAGRHTVALDEARGIAPGLYWLRLTRGDGMRTARGVVSR